MCASHPKLTELLQENHHWSESKSPTFFSDHAKGQEPKVLFIACADSRVTPSVITKSKLGQLFVSRNVANLVVETDQSMQAVVSYAVAHLKVEHIVICGHYGCGGVKAAMDIAESNTPLEPEISNWLKPIINLYNRHKNSLSLIENDVERYKALIKKNVEQQLINMSNIKTVKEAFANPDQISPVIHGAIYDLDNGKLKVLDESLESLKIELDKIIIQEQIAILAEKAKSYNPFNFIGAQSKQQLIETALNEVRQNKQHIPSELNNVDSNLYKALNHKRLLPFTFKGFNQSTWFSNKANFLLKIESELNIESDENHMLSDQMCCK